MSVKSIVERIAALKSPEECQVFAKNALRLGHAEAAGLARQREIELRAAKHGARSEVERECYEAVHAYEEIKRRRATRTWQMIKRHGVLSAVERLVTKSKASSGYEALAEMGLRRFAFEAVVLRHPEDFSHEALSCSRERLGDDWRDK